MSSVQIDLCIHLNLQKKRELQENMEFICIDVSVTSLTHCFPVTVSLSELKNVVITDNYIRKLLITIIKNVNFSLRFSQFCLSSIMQISKLLGVPGVSYSETD